MPDDNKDQPIAPEQPKMVPTMQVAARRKRPEADQGVTSAVEPPLLGQAESAPDRSGSLSKLAPDPKEQQQRQERSSRLRALQRSRTNEGRKMMNVPLPMELRHRLQKASFDYDVKMTKIMIDAIDTYLTENGY